MSNEAPRQQRGPRVGGPMMGPGRMPDKPKNFKESWRKLLKYCNRYLPFIILSLVMAAAGTIFQLFGPDKLKNITNLIGEGMPYQDELTGVWIDRTVVLEPIIKIAVTLMILYILALICRVIDNWVMAVTTQKLSKNLRSDISTKINKLPLKYFDKVSYGDILSRVTNDVDTISQTMNQSLDTMVGAIVMFCGAILMMFITNWIMALTAIISSLLGFVLLSFIMKKSQKYFIAQQKGLGDINGHIEEIYSGHNIVKAYNGSKEAKETFEKYNSDLENSGVKSQFISGLMQPLMGFVGNFGYVAICVVGASLAIGGHISFGVIVAFILYTRWFTQPLTQMAQALQNMQRTAAAGERVFEFLGETELADETNKTRVLNHIKGDVEFRNVHFGYDADKPIIHNFSASVKSGQKIAIVGPTGAGKTTMVNLLMRFYEVNGGEILIDGIPISELTRENVHDQFCMVLQDTWLYEGTIKDNIIYSKKGVSEEDVINASKAVGLHHFINTLPKGYETILDDKSGLSQGQRQLVTIARAMIQNSPMLILDEATSSVDTRTEVLIQEAMDKLMVGRTSFVIAHRLSTIKNADIILVMKNGDIVEKGNHNHLLALNGFYADLYNSQFETA